MRLAEDGQEALERIREAMPDAVVTDCQMPRMDGLTFAQTLHNDAATRHLPVVMLTAKGFELSSESLREEYGILDVICKPFSPRKLVERVEQILDQQVAV